MGITEVDEGQRFVHDRVVDPEIKADPQLAAYFAEQEAQAKKWREAASLIKEWYRSALKNTWIDTSEFVNYEARRAFWETAGIYEKFSREEIEYINKMVIPAVAAAMVTSNEEGLMDLWRATNRVDTNSNVANAGVDVFKKHLAGGSDPTLDQVVYNRSMEEIVELYNGSTLALGILYQAGAHGLLGSASGQHAFEAQFVNYLESALIPTDVKPEEDKPLLQPQPGEPDEYESFRWTYRLTK